MMSTRSESVADVSVPAVEKTRGTHGAAGVRSPGVLNMNADDWGRDRDNTDRTFQCVSRGTVNSVSAMVFMEDSERAASIVRENEVEAGLHLNFTTPFSAKDCPSDVQARQGELAKFLRANRFAQVLFHPLLAKSFEYVVSAQIDEFQRIYGGAPQRLDGHHHMHLCSNVLLGRLLPAGILVRRSFTFEPGEKAWINRFYRRRVDGLLARRYRKADCFFSLIPLNPPERLKRIFELADTRTVEVETHPVNIDEFRFLMGDEVLRLSEKLRSAVVRNERAQVSEARLPGLSA
jgi:chitin disaccharide deacetylase